MSVSQPDPESGQPTASDLPAFQVVLQGCNPAQVDAYLPQLIARLEGDEQARAALQAGRSRRADRIGGETYGRCCWCSERACYP